MKGHRVAIFGLGRSGLAIGKAVLQLGGEAHVFDEKPLGSLPKRDVYNEAISLGLSVSLGWKGDLSDEKWAMVVVNPAVPRTHPKLVAAAEKGIVLISEVEFAYRISKAPIVAITGTNGKSTTTVMTMLCLRACGEDAILCGNIFGSGYAEVPMTEAALNATEDQILVAEISSFQLEWIADFKPAVAGITNISPDHLDRYPSFEAYVATKQRIFEKQDHTDYAVVRANDPIVVPPGRKLTTYRPRHSRQPDPKAEHAIQQGLHATGDFLHDGKPDVPTVFTFGATGQDAKVEETELSILNRHIRMELLPFQEPHNFTNATMAALLSYAILEWKAEHFPTSSAAKLVAQAQRDYLGHKAAKRTVYDARRPEEVPLRVLPQEIVKGLQQFKGLAHRMELLGSRDRIRVINNSMCTNPDAVIKSAQSVRDPSHLLIGGVNKGLDFKPLANYLANHRNKAYLFGSDAEALDNMLGGGYPIFANLANAFQAAVLEARPGEVIMLAPGCASTDQFSDFRDRGEVFRTIAKEWLES
jgi:UDP-N-acetylmuramoylalanine--D-glutamate ligase